MRNDKKKNLLKIQLGIHTNNNHGYWYYNQRLEKTFKHICFVNLIKNIQIILRYLHLTKKNSIPNILYIQNCTVCYHIQFHYSSITLLFWHTLQVIIYFFHTVHRCYLLIIFQHTYARAYCSKSTYTSYTTQCSVICYCTTQCYRGNSHEVFEYRSKAYCCICIRINKQVL